MKAVKSVTASVKETVQNVVARADEHAELNKAVAQVKAERKAAENKAEKHDAVAHYHARQAEIIREYELKKAQNKAVKEQTKAAYHQKKADKHADKHADKTDAGMGVDDRATTNTARPSDNPIPAGAPGETLNDRNTSTPASSDFPEPAAEARDETTDTNVPGAIPDSRHSQVPMHGSGVPTHSELHDSGDAHDIHTTQTMGGSPNTGSYM